VNSGLDSIAPGVRTEQDERKIRARIIESYDDVIIRLYCRIRFIIINLRILNELEQYLPQAGRVLDIGCGFGLFSHYFALTGPGRRFLSFDLQPKRIDSAKRASAKVGDSHQIEFMTMNALEYQFQESMDAIVTLDLLHHLPADRVPPILECCYNNLSDEGILLVKDIESVPRYKVWFTWILDKFMDPMTPVHYYSRQQMSAILYKAGFDVKSHQMLDILPYPHILYVCRKRKPGAGA